MQECGVPGGGMFFVIAETTATTRWCEVATGGGEFAAVVHLGRRRVRQLSELRGTCPPATRVGRAATVPFGHMTEINPLVQNTVIPQLAEAPSFGSPQADIFNRLLQERIVVLGTDVNDGIANYITAQLLYLEGQDAEKPIWLYINSPGGSVTAGMAIYDTMQFVQPEVGTICMGLGASMGQFLLCAGAPGKRYALPHARIMMHQPLGGVQGQATDIAIQAEQMAYTKRLLQERIAQHTGQTYETIEADSDRDRWFTAEQAKDYGLIDHVIVKRGEML